MIIKNAKEKKPILATLCKYLLKTLLEFLLVGMEFLIILLMKRFKSFKTNIDKIKYFPYKAISIFIYIRIAIYIVLKFLISINRIFNLFYDIGPRGEQNLLHSLRKIKNKIKKFDLICTTQTRHNGCQPDALIIGKKNNKFFFSIPIDSKYNKQMVLLEHIKKYYFPHIIIDYISEFLSIRGKYPILNFNYLLYLEYSYHPIGFFSPFVLMVNNDNLYSKEKGKQFLLRVTREMEERKYRSNVKRNIIDYCLYTSDFYYFMLKKDFPSLIKELKRRNIYLVADFNLKYVINDLI